jgi:spermidine/putrescine transport system permease protein
MVDESGKFSAGDFVALLCSAAIAVAFLYLPWVSGPDLGETALRFLDDVPADRQGDVSLLWLIPLASGVSGLAALWGLFNASARRMTKITAALAGTLGLYYYGLFFVQNIPNYESVFDTFGLVRVGFWVGLVASIGLIFQIFVPRQRVTLWVFLSPGIIYLLVFFLAPLVVIVTYSFLDNRYPFGLTWVFETENYVRLTEPLYRKIFWRSFFIGGVTTVTCFLIGYPAAYWLATRSPKIRNTLLLMMIFPFWTNFVVRTYAWRFILGNEGLINQSLISLGVIDESIRMINTQYAVVAGLVYGWIIAMVLPCYASISGLDHSLLEAAEDLYANRVQTFLRVTFPLTIRGVFAGSILVFIPSFGAFITPDLLGGGKADMIGNVIQRQFGTSLNYPFGSALSTLLMIVMLLGAFLYFRILRADRTHG